MQNQDINPLTDQQARDRLRNKVSKSKAKIKSQAYLQLGTKTLQIVHQMFNPDIPVILCLPALTTTMDTDTTLMLFVIQEGRHCMPTTDYYFTNIQPAPIMIPPPHRGNHSDLTAQHAATKDQIPQQTHPLWPGKTRVYPSMLADKQVPVLDLTNSTITSQVDLQTAFQSLHLCEEDNISHGRKQPKEKKDTS